MVEMIAPGSAAPGFDLQDQEGSPVRLQHYVGKKNLVLVFYTKDNTPG